MSFRLRNRFVIFSVLAVMGAARPAAAQVYDAAADFSIVNNPNGAWSYGFTNTLNSDFILDTDGAVGTQIDQWRGDRAGDGNPSISHNKTGVVVQNRTVTYQPGQLIMHPGPNGEYSTMRWTAPAAGMFLLNTQFSGQDSTTTDIHIFDNGVSVFSGAINGYQDTKTFSDYLSVKASDVIDIKVGYGNGTFFNDSTGVSARFTTVPAPGSLWITALGAIPGVLLLRRCRKTA